MLPINIPQTATRTWPYDLKSSLANSLFSHPWVSQRTQWNIPETHKLPIDPRSSAMHGCYTSLLLHRRWTWLSLHLMTLFLCLTVLSFSWIKFGLQPHPLFSSYLDAVRALPHPLSTGKTGRKWRSLGAILMLFLLCPGLLCPLLTISREPWLSQGFVFDI